MILSSKTIYRTARYAFTAYTLMFGLQVVAAELVIPKFIEETASSGLQSRYEGADNEFVVGGGLATFDCDDDGLSDIYVSAGVNKAKFYRNKSSKGGALKLQEERSGLETTYATGAYPIDIDSDGKIDVVVLRVGEVQAFKGLGACKFEPANDLWNIHSQNNWHTAFSATWEKGNHLPTLAFGTYTDRTKPEFPWGTCTPTLFLRPQNPGDKVYGKSLELKPGHCALSMLFSDWSHSGQVDLRMSNDREYYKGGHEELWHIKQGELPKPYTAEEGFKPLQIWGMGIASQDIDGDEVPEVFLTSMADNKLQKLGTNAGGKNIGPSYNDIAFKQGVTAHRPYVGGDVQPSTGWHAQFEDVNQDGLMDLWIVKGNVSSMPDFAMQDPNNLLLQQSDGTFIEVGDKAGINSFWRGRGGMLVDLNADGMLDMLVVNRKEKAQIWRNISLGLGGWLELRLQQTGSNANAIGAWIQIDADGKRINRELTIGAGHASGNLGWMHVGLGAAKNTKLRVQWPNNGGAWSEWQSVQANGFYVVNKEAGIKAWQP